MLKLVPKLKKGHAARLAHAFRKLLGPQNVRQKAPWVQESIDLPMVGSRAFYCQGEGYVEGRVSGTAVTHEIKARAYVHVLVYLPVDVPGRSAWSCRKTGHVLEWPLTVDSKCFILPEKPLSLGVGVSDYPL